MTKEIECVSIYDRTTRFAYHLHVIIDSSWPCGRSTALATIYSYFFHHYYHFFNKTRATTTPWRYVWPRFSMPCIAWYSNWAWKFIFTERYRYFRGFFFFRCCLLSQGLKQIRYRSFSLDFIKELALIWIHQLDSIKLVIFKFISLFLKY